MTTYDRQKMKNITIALPNELILAMDQIQEIGDYPSRSEILRVAAREQLEEDLTFQTQLNGGVKCELLP